MKLEWKTEQREVKDLKVWEENPRTIDESSFKDLKDSIEQDGDWGILVIDTDGTVISGNQRLKANEGKVDVKVPNRPLTDKERKRIALRANRTKGKDNWDVLANWNEDELLSGWLNEEEIMMRIGLNEAEGQYVDEDRFNVLMVMPPGSPQLKERINLNCETIEDYLKVKEYVSKNGVDGIMETILQMV